MSHHALAAMNQQPMHITLLNTWRDVRAIRHLWEDLLAQSAVSSPFLTYDWCDAWWTAFGNSRDPFVLCFFGPQDQLVGIAPLYRTSRPDHTKTRLPLRMLRFLGTGTGGVSTSLGFVMRRGYEDLGARHLLQWLSRARSEWDVLDLHLMPSQWLPTMALSEEITRSRWFHVRRAETRLSIRLPDTYEDYLKSLSRTMRTQLPRQRRRLLRHFGVTIRQNHEEGELRHTLDALFQINTQRWQERGQRGSFATDEHRVFAQEMTRRFLSRGFLDFWSIELDGRVAAVECGLRYKDVYYALWAGLDTHFNSFSSGSVLKSHIIQQLIRDGIRVYDFLQGDEPYKMHWGPERLAYTNLLCAAPRSVGAMYLRTSAWNSAAKLRVTSIPRELKEGLRSVLPATMWNALRTAHSAFRLGRGAA